MKTVIGDNQTVAAVVFDLEEVLPTPSSTESCLYYKQKLNTFDLTVYDYRHGQGFCHVWPETEGQRGSNEIASSIYRYLQRLRRDGIKVILFSDNCGGQKRNKNLKMSIFSLLAVTVKTKETTCIKL